MDGELKVEYALSVVSQVMSLVSVLKILESTFTSGNRNSRYERERDSSADRKSRDSNHNLRDIKGEQKGKEPIKPLDARSKSSNSSHSQSDKQIYSSED
jgi:hypothetical protein